MLPHPAAASPAPAGSAELAVYATRLPDPARLHYRLLRGASVGTATLHWQRGEGGDALRLDVEWSSHPAQGAARRGQISADGVALLRRAELRRARGQRAVNFQREAATVTFSGPQVAYALPPGAQDRLSWMIKLPAILEADAALACEGAAVTPFVAGTRGDVEPWRFEVLRHEALELPAGTVARALRLRREPTRPGPTTPGSKSGSTRRANTCRCARCSPRCPAASRCSGNWRHWTAALKSTLPHPAKAAGGSLMEMLYNSDSFAVLQIEFGLADTQAEGGTRGGFEIVDKFARKGIFIEGAVAQSFKDGVQALIDSGPTQEALDDYIAGYTTLAQQPVHLH
jgi:hypothetical protein